MAELPASEPVEVVQQFIAMLDSRPNYGGRRAIIPQPLVERLCSALRDYRAFDLLVQNTLSLPQAAYEVGCSEAAIFDSMNCGVLYGCLSHDGHLLFSRRRILELQRTLQNSDAIKRSFPPGWWQQPQKRSAKR
jgi:hypothetical protein